MCIRDRHRANKKQLIKRYFEHLNAYKKPEIYTKSNLATHAINTGHEFPDITRHDTCLLYTSCCATIISQNIIGPELYRYKTPSMRGFIPKHKNSH